MRITPNNAGLGARVEGIDLAQPLAGNAQQFADALHRVYFQPQRLASRSASIRATRSVLPPGG